MNSIRATGLLLGLVLSLAPLTACTGDAPAPNPTASATPGSTTTRPASPGELRQLLAAPPAGAIPVPVEGAPDGDASADVLALLYSRQLPEAFSQRLLELGFQEGAAYVWRLDQLVFLSVNLLRLRDASAARLWADDRRQEWTEQEQDANLPEQLGLGTDFLDGTSGSWFVGPQLTTSENPDGRIVSAVFYRGNVVVHLQVTTKDDGTLLTVRDFAREQFTRLP